MGPTGLACLRRQLARRICPGDGSSAPGRPSVDENRRPAPDDPRRPPRRRGNRREQQDIDDLNRAWHRLDPWPDTVPGLTRLKEKFTITTLSNGNVSLLTNMAKRAGLPWDCVISAELFHHYKPDPQAYLGCADLLDVPPDELMLVAAHPSDLRAARDAGLMTAYVDRPLEFGPNRRSQGGRRRIQLHRNGFSGSCGPAGGVSRRRTVER